MDVSAHHEPGPCPLDRLQDRAAADVTAARLVHVAERRGVRDQHPALRAPLQKRGGLLLGQVEAPLAERRDGNRTPQPPEGDAVDLASRAVQDTRRGPPGARPHQLGVGLPVSGNQHRRRRRLREHPHGLLESPSHDREIPGADEHVRFAGPMREPARRLVVPVYVAAEEEPHRCRPRARPVSRGKRDGGSHVASRAGRS